MKAFYLSRLISVLLVFTTLAAALPREESIEVIGAPLKARQDSNSQSNSDSASSATETGKSSGSASGSDSATTSVSPTVTTKPSSGAAASSSGSAAATSGGSAAATTGVSGSSKTSGSGTKTTKESSSTTAIDPRLPPGGVEMITPAANGPSTYYKIGNFLTFGWNYTSLSVTPSAIDILASCSANSATYTIALNQSVDPTGAVTWDTGKYQKTATVPLLTETYTLVIHDAAQDISATAKAGFLGVFDQFTFGMYTPQPYTPLNEFKCATCSAAISDMERQAFGFLLTMGTITILSFTWFAGGFGVFS